MPRQVFTLLPRGVMTHPAQSIMPRSRPEVAHPVPGVSVDDEPVLQLVPDAPSAPEATSAEDAALEAELMAAIDVEADLEQLVPMPPSIPAALRRLLNERFAERFLYMDELDAWLHLPHPKIGAESPFQRLVAGDGWSVLRALQIGPTDVGSELGGDVRSAPESALDYGTMRPHQRRGTVDRVTGGRRGPQQIQRGRMLRRRPTTR